MSGMTGGWDPLALGTNVRQWFLDQGNGYRSTELNGIPVLHSIESHGTYREPRKGRNCLYDGTNDHLVLPAAVHALVSKSLDWSLALKFSYTGAPSGNRNLVGWSQSGSDRFAVSWTAGDLKVGIFNGADFTDLTESGAVVADTVYELIIAFDTDGPSGTAWLNGVAMSGANPPATQTPAVAFIGALNSDANYWLGRIWDVRVWNSTLASAAAAASVSPTHHYYMNEESGLDAYDSRGGQNGTYTSITQSTFHAADAAVTNNPANEVGHTETGGVIIPRNESDTDNDVLGAALEYTGRAPYPAQVNTPVATFDGTDDLITLSSAIRSLVATANDFSMAFKLYIPTGISNSNIFGSALGTNDRFAIEISAASVDIRCGVYNGAWVAESGVASLDAWLEIVVIYDAADSRGIQLFIAGAEQSGSTSPNSAATVATTLGCLNGSSAFADIRVCDLRFFNSKLSTEAEARTTTPTYFFPLQEGAGNIVYDAVASETGTITGTLSEVWANTTVEVEDHSIGYGGGHVGFFDGVDDSISLPAAVKTALSSAGDFSVSFWTLPVSGTHVFLGSRVDANDRLSIAAGGVDVRVTVRDTSSFTKSGSTSVTAWNHVVVTWVNSSSTLALYINNSAQVGSSGSSLENNSANAKLGSRDGASGFLSAQLSRVRIYSDLLTTDEITFLFNGGGDDPGTAALVASYLLDTNGDDSGDNAYDGEIEGLLEFPAVPALLSAATLPIGGTPAATRIAPNFGNVNSSINCNPYTAAELNALTGIETAYGLGFSRQGVPTLDTKFRRAETDGDDRFFAVDTALTGADLTSAELYVSGSLDIDFFVRGDGSVAPDNDIFRFGGTFKFERTRV